MKLSGPVTWLFSREVLSPLFLYMPHRARVFENACEVTWKEVCESEKRGGRCC